MTQKQANFLEGTFAGGGQMGTLMCNFDWASTSLGSVENWSQSLRTSVGILLNSHYPVVIAWGCELLQFYNDAFIPLLGDKHPHALGQKIPQAWPEFWSGIVPLLQKVIDTGEGAFLENMQLFVMRNGYIEEVYLNFSCSPIRDDNGLVGGIFIACIETTQTAANACAREEERKRTEASAQVERVAQLPQSTTEYERQLRLLSEVTPGKLHSILESITDSFIALDKDWRIVYINQKAARKNGQTPNEIVGKNHWEHWHWLAGTQIEQEYHRAVAEQVPVHFEVPCQPLNTWLEIHAYPSEDGLNVFLRDITERKRIEVMLRESEERLRLAIEGAGLAMWDWDLVSGQIICSDGSQAMLGLTADTKMTYEIFLNAVYLDDREGVERAVQQAIAGENDYNVEYRTIWADGTVHWLASKARVYRDENGKPIRMTGVGLDITAQKQAQEALHQSEAHLAMAQKVAQVGSWEFDLASQKIIWSETTFQHWGFEPTQSEPSYAELLERVYPE